MADLLDIVGRLPQSARNELLDFAEFLDRKYSGPEPWPEQADWQAMTAVAASKVWHNPEDDVYGKLL